MAVVVGSWSDGDAGDALDWPWLVAVVSWSCLVGLAVLSGCGWVTVDYVVSGAVEVV